MPAWLLIAGVLVVGPVDFDADVMPIFTKAGCNTAACHGAAAGRGGLALSLYGARPGDDYNSIVRQRKGRRINLREPAASLILAKPTGLLEHGGDVRLDGDGPHAATIATWIREGARRETSASLVHLEVSPADAWFESLPAQVQLVPIAVYADGTRRDVRDLAVYAAADDAAVKFTHNGQATLLRRGRQVVTVRFATDIAAVTLTTPIFDDILDLSASPRHNFVDDEILTMLERLRLAPALPTDDASFLRRVRLDLTGRLPGPSEIDEFLADNSGDKRTELVDRWLNSAEFTEYWTHRLGTWLRIGRPGSDTIATQKFYGWLRRSVADGMPLDEMARAMVTADGDTHRVGPANFYRGAGDARGQAEYFSEVLLGVRLRCANCHNHPLDRWTQDDYHGLAAMFAPLEQGRTIRFIGRGEVSHPATGEAAIPRIPGFKSLSTSGDHRGALATWLTADDNPYFAHALVNRLWSALMGRGLVEPVDDFRATNPATHPALLNKLARDFAAHHYDLRHVLRTIATSAAYARSSHSESDLHATAYYACAAKKSLSPEVRLDAICDVLGVPASDDGSWTRAINYIGPADAAPTALTQLGRCSRSGTCESGEQTVNSLARQLAILNGELLNSLLERQDNRLAELVALPIDESVAKCYLTTLSRRPRGDEAKFWRGKLDAKDARERRVRLEDFVWSLLNCDEFVHNH
jgi:hypothetical protein